MAQARRLATAAFASVLLIAAAAACGGDDEPPSRPPTQATAQASATHRPSSTATIQATRTAAPTPLSTRERVSSTPSRSTSSFDVNSFRYQVNVSFAVAGEADGVELQITGEFVAPDSHHFTQTFEFAGFSGTEESIIVGNEAWMREDDGDWDTASLQLINTDLTSLDPEFIADRAFISDMQPLDGDADEVDGRPAIRHSFTFDQLEQIAELFGDDFIETGDLDDIEDFTMSVWIDEEADILLRAEIAATAAARAFGDSGLDLDPDQLVTASITLLVSDVDVASIRIDPPR